MERSKSTPAVEWESWEQMEARHMDERREKMMLVARKAYRSGLDKHPMDMKANPMRAIHISVAEIRGISPKELRSKNRSKEIAHARFEAFYLQQQAGFSLPEIGKFYGMDHTSVLHGIRRHQGMRGDA
jgi:chromosomal replication initiation ATPase DnaA